MFKKAVLVGVLGLAQWSGVALALDENTAKEVGSDLATAVSAATDMISAMQADINAGKADAAKVKPAAFLDAFYAKYQATANKAFDAKTSGLVGESHTKLADAISDVMAENNKAILKGGQDAFVPAYFRAQVFAKFNASMKGKVAGYATNANDNLINGDSAVDRILKGSPLMGEVSKLVNGANASPAEKAMGGHYMVYRPLKLKEACVACHTKNGLKQQVGGYGGALVIDVKL